MAMSAEHKAALAQGRREAKAIKDYLAALDARRPGRPVTKASLEKKMASLDSRIEGEPDPLKRVELRQQRIDTEKIIREFSQQVDPSKLEAGFVEHAASYSARKGISYTAWREAGVSPDTLRKAGVARTRKS